MLYITEERILELLFDNLTKEYSIHEISTTLKIPYPQTHRNIQSLIKRELVISEKVGKSNMISLRKDSVKKEYITAELNRRDNALKKYPILRRVISDLEKIPQLQYICVVFGSYAKGISKKNSDIDLLFIIPKDYDYGKFEMMTHQAFVTGYVDINIGIDESLHEMWSTPSKLNVANEVLKGHIILKGTEGFLEAWRKHNVG